LPEEEVHYHSRSLLKYGTKRYEIIVTNKRLLMFARRGVLFPGDDVVSFRMDDLHRIHFKESGFFPRVGTIAIEGKTTIQLEGLAPEAKMVYTQLMQFL